MVPGLERVEEGLKVLQGPRAPGVPTLAHCRAGRVPLGVVGRVPRRLLQQSHVAQHAGEDEEHGQGVGPPATQTQPASAHREHAGNTPLKEHTPSLTCSSKPTDHWLPVS